MNKTLQKISIFALILGIFLPSLSYASTGVVNTGARMRAGTSISHTILTVMPKGTIVTILGEEHGWYKVQDPFGRQGYTATWLINKQTADIGLQTSDNNGQETLDNSKKSSASNAVSTKKTGKLLYNSRIRKGPSTSDEIITIKSKGSTVTILEEKNDWMNISVAGVEGWTASWLIDEQTANVGHQTSDIEINKEVSKITTPESKTTVISNTPVSVDEDELNTYWLSKINALRADKGLRQLVLDDRWKATASEYAKYMGETGATNHERADGKSMHKWIDTKGLDFTTRYSENGWKINYFTENIGWGITSGTTEDVKRVLDQTLAFYLSEASYNGAHYRTIYHADWNSVGSGFYFKKLDNGKYKVSAVFHYGSLELK